MLSNSHTEPITATTTDKLSSSKPSVRSESSITPCSGSKTAARPNSQVAARNSAYQDTSKRDDEWLYVSDNDVDDQQLLDLIDRETMQPPDTPSKSIKRNAASSPGKRPHEEFQERSKGRPIYGKPTADIELFNTSNEIRGRGIFSAVRSVPQPRGTGKVGGLISPEITPAAIRVGPPHNHQDSSEGSLVMRDDTPAARTSSIIEYPDLDSDLLTPKKSVEKESYMTPLAQQILDALHSENTKMTDKIVRSVKTISVKHVIKTNQALKGLEWCREMIKKQKIQIVDLEAEIAKLKQGPSAKR